MRFKLQERMSRLLVFFLLAVISSGSEGYFFRRVCEHQRMTINCGSKAINIQSATYGRTRRGICGFRNNRNTNCHAGTSMMLAKYECQGQSRCTLHAKNSAFGDPCRGTFKYLEVRYECVPKAQICFQDSILLRICEHRTQTITCPYCKPKINIISANYGRLTGGHICGGPVRTTNCGAARSHDKVKKSCQGRRSCRLRASNGIYGDPCVGTYKYLEVRYRCEE